MASSAKTKRVIFGGGGGKRRSSYWGPKPGCPMFWVRGREECRTAVEEALKWEGIGSERKLTLLLTQRGGYHNLSVAEEGGPI